MGEERGVDLRTTTIRSQAPSVDELPFPAEAPSDKPLSCEGYFLLIFTIHASILSSHLSISSSVSRISLSMSRGFEPGSLTLNHMLTMLTLESDEIEAEG